MSTVIAAIDAEIASIKANVAAQALRLEGLIKARELLGGGPREAPAIDVSITPKAFFLNETHELPPKNLGGRPKKDGTPAASGIAAPKCAKCPKPCSKKANGSWTKTCGEYKCVMACRAESRKANREAEGD